MKKRSQLGLLLALLTLASCLPDPDPVTGLQLSARAGIGEPVQVFLKSGPVTNQAVVDDVIEKTAAQRYLAFAPTEEDLVFYYHYIFNESEFYFLEEVAHVGFMFNGGNETYFYSQEQERDYTLMKLRSINEYTYAFPSSEVKPLEMEAALNLYPSERHSFLYDGQEWVQTQRQIMLMKTDDQWRIPNFRFFVYDDNTETVLYEGESINVINPDHQAYQQLESGQFLLIQQRYVYFD